MFHSHIIYKNNYIFYLIYLPEFDFLILDSANTSWQMSITILRDEYTQVEISGNKVCRMIESNYSPMHTVGTVHNVDGRDV